MSAGNTSRNNRGVPPSGFETPLGHTRDAKYYHEDGSVTVLVEGILFKFPACLILRPDSTSPARSTNGGAQPYYIGIDNLQHDFTRSSDEDPISLPNVRASQFRNFLFAIMGLPFDPEYRALMVDAQDKKKHNQSLLVRYLDIACLARQFRMTELEEWARSQLSLVLESVYSLALDYWDAMSLLRLDSYTRATGQADLVALTTTFIQYFVSTSAGQHNDSQSPLPTHLDTCVQLYNDPALRANNPTLFGCVFATILSLGRRSRIWNEQLAQSDRRVLYVAQAALTSVSTELRSVTWLKSPAHSPLPKLRICEGCRTQLNVLWTATFGRCEGLKSEVILQDVTALARLPQFRKDLVAQWDTARACFYTQATPDLHSLALRVASFYIGRNIAGAQADAIARREPRLTSSRPDRFRCPKLEGIIKDIDGRIQGVYREIARRHADFASEA